MKNIVVILAGGLGKRMESTKPKVIQLIHDKPMLVRLLIEVFKTDPYKVLIVVGKYKDVIHQELLKYIPDIDQKIEWVMQEPALGTGHAVLVCLDNLKENIDAKTVVLYGDTPYTNAETINDLINETNEVSIITTVKENPSGSGRIIEKDGVFVKITEEKDATIEEKKIKKINCGLYCFDNNLLCKYITNLDNNNTQGEYYLTDVVELIKNGENVNVKLYDIPIDKQYQVIGVNTKKQLEELEIIISNL